MLPATQAEQIILSLTQPLDLAQDVEVLSLLDATERILAAAVVSSLDFPHWDNSAMDGYAVRYKDVQSCSAEQPVWLEIVEEIPAGYQPQKPIQAGQAARILTGSVMPVGADAIAVQEEAQRDGHRVAILKAPKPQAFVRHQGTFYRAGSPLLPAGLKLQAPEIAVLAAAQCRSVTVYRRPRVAILSTGSELVDIDQPLQPGQIVDSNQYALAALVAQAGAEPLCLGRVPDEPDALRQAIAQSVTSADIVLSSGGVSVGDYDYVDEILAALGAEIHIRAVAVRPGKPLTVAIFRNQEVESREIIQNSKFKIQNSPLPTLYFGLPGNPVSALVTFWRFVQPALRKLSGVPQPWGPAFMTARTRQELKSDGKRESYLWGKLYLIDGTYEFELAGGSHSSGNLINLAGTNGLAIVPLGETLIAAGAQIQVLQV
ncbi:MAG: molybdopterin molybdotransferase MoeA [Leptolyngbyaceae cyanobacterium RU_5_1]|nr:molybdopterin molybdotransferase MoeA [Leptolyngbyaceae cyanobacterium RU_5_1]